MIIINKGETVRPEKTIEVNINNIGTKSLYNTVRRTDYLINKGVIYLRAVAISRILDVSRTRVRYLITKGKIKPDALINKNLLFSLDNINNVFSDKEFVSYLKVGKYDKDGLVYYDGKKYLPKLKASEILLTTPDMVQRYINLGILKKVKKVDGLVLLDIEEVNSIVGKFYFMYEDKYYCEDEYMTLTSLASKLGIDSDKVRNLLEQNNIKMYQINKGNARVVKIDDFNALMDNIISLKDICRDARLMIREVLELEKRKELEINTYLTPWRRYYTMESYKKYKYKYKGVSVDACKDM